MPARPMCRSDIFWRTMCGDSYNKISPAPEDFRFQIEVFMVALMIDITFINPEGLLEFTKAKLDETLGNGRWKQKFHWLAAMLWDNPGFQVNIDKFIESITVYEEVIRLKYLIQPFTTAHCEIHCSARAHFGDLDGRYGIGPLSMEAGDEIWIIAGEPVPCVLRPAEADHYEFIGEAYIYGIMQGELADFGLLRDTRDIVLV